MNPPKLPHDVLLAVASFADGQGILALLTTCRSLHSDCAKYILKDPVLLGGDEEIISFMEFMRPHKYKRWRHLRSLHLLDSQISPHVAEEFARAIPRASQLGYLEFDRAEKTLAAHPDLPLAFAAIPSVKHIVIGHGRSLACRMLEAMHWPLESAVLSHSDYVRESDDPDIQDRMHPAVLLKNSCATLKALECEYWSGFGDITGTYPVYPRLEFLHVEGSWCPQSAQWAVSYPNLKRLSVDTVAAHFLDDGEDDGEDDFERHTINRLSNQSAYSRQEQRWGELEKFAGSDALDLYLLALPCRIRDIALHLSTSSLPCFGPIMATARPTRLRLSITTELFSQPIPTYLEDPGLTDLKSLVLDVIVWVGGLVHDDTGNIDVDRFLGYVFGTLRRASAREFTLCLEVDRSKAHPMVLDDPGEQNGEAIGPRAGAPSRIETWVNNTDLDALVDRFLGEVPSLEKIKLFIQAPGSDWQRVESSRRGQLTAS